MHRAAAQLGRLPRCDQDFGNLKMKDNNRRILKGERKRAKIGHVVVLQESIHDGHRSGQSNRQSTHK